MLALLIAISVVLFIIFLLSLPLDLSFDCDVREEFRSRVRIGLFGLVWRQVSEKKRARDLHKQHSLKPLLSLVKTNGVPVRLQNLIRRIPACVKVRQLDADFRIGLDDPVDTGMLCALLWPFLGAFGPVPMKVKLQPSFYEPALEGAFSATIRLSPIKIVSLFSVFACSRTGFKTTRSAIAAWRRRAQPA